LLVIPVIYVKDKQAFRKEGSILRLLGKPGDVAKTFKEKGFRLLHIIDLDALAGLSTNLDIYDSLTYFINVQVECAPVDALVKKLLSLRCRVVLPPSQLDLSEIKEKNLLVAKISKDSKQPLDDFHDVIIEDADADSVEKFKSMGKRVILFKEDKEKINEQIWGVITLVF